MPKREIKINDKICPKAVAADTKFLLKPKLVTNIKYQMISADPSWPGGIGKIKNNCRIMLPAKTSIKGAKKPIA